MTLQELATAIMGIDYRLTQSPARERVWNHKFVVEKLQEAYNMGKIAGRAEVKAEMEMVMVPENDA